MRTRLLGKDGKTFEVLEPIPGVFISTKSNVSEELNRLFPKTTFPHLHEKYPHLFRDDVSSSTISGLRR